MRESPCTIRDYFFNDENELRSVWRVFVFILVYQVVFLLLGSLLAVLGILLPSLRNLLNALGNPATSGLPYLTSFGVINLLALFATLGANGICARWLERRSFASTGFQFHSGWWRDFLLGSLVGALTISLAVVIALLSGATTLQSNSQSFGFLLQSFSALLLFFMISAAYEEALVRGFAFQALEHNLGAGIAVTVTAVVFGLLHLQNANVTLFSTLNTMLAGVWLGVAYLMTRSLWLATALHYAWNFVMVFVFGLPVSGITKFQELAWLRGESSVRWVSGGEYGPEGGIAATVALLLSTLLLWKGRLFKTTEEMAAAVQHGKPEEPLQIVPGP